MISVAAEGKTPLHEEWLEQLPSHLVHHGACCDEARDWLIAMARSFDFAVTERQAHAGPRFLSELYAWGPNPWPLSWCEAVRRKTIDCGVFAAFAREILRAKGLAAYPGQVVQRFDEQSTGHWQKLWAGESKAFAWVGETHVYHEVVIVRRGATGAAIYDPTDGCWLDPADRGPGALVAVRSEAPGVLSWGGMSLVNERWSRMP